MKTLLVVIIPIVLLSCSNDSSTSQTQEDIDTSTTDTNIIDLPEWIGDNELETINKIEAQNNLDYNDYIQLAVSYAQLESDSSKIRPLLDKALSSNTEQACKSLIFLLDNQQDWKITSNHKELVNAMLFSYNCIR